MQLAIRQAVGCADGAPPGVLYVAATPALRAIGVVLSEILASLPDSVFDDFCTRLRTSVIQNRRQDSELNLVKMAPEGRG